MIPESHSVGGRQARASAPAGSASDSIRYRIAAASLRAHRFEVSCTVARPDPAGQRWRLPTWIPGSYLIREFARHVVAIRAERDGSPVAIEKEAKDAWRVAAGSGPITVTAEVFALDLSVRGAYLDTERGFFNGACVFLCPEGFEASPCTLEIVSPDDPAAADWRIATTLARDPAPGDTTARGFGRYRAANYDELIDHPVEMGRFELASFEAGGVRHTIAVSGARSVALHRLSADLARVCRWQIELFGGAGASPPFDRYLFLVHATDRAHGGLEHRASSSLLCLRHELPRASPKPEPRPAAPAIDDDYLRFLGLASHEYFHAWNVKRVKPAAFIPYDLAREAYTRQLWIFEGVTSYYDDLALVRCGLIDATRYLELVARSITMLLRAPGRAMQSLAESSFDAWIKHYRPDVDTPNAAISYYLKGSLVALALDLTLRREGRTSLDDVMRALWRRYGEPATGLPEAGFRAVAEELAGHSLAPFFDAYVNGKAELPLAGLLDEFGIELHLRSAAGATDKGGRPASGPPARCWFGATVETNLALRHVFSGGPAERAGLAPGDVLVAFDGIKATPESFAALATRRAPGERIDVHLFRREALQTRNVELTAAPQDTVWLTLRGDENAQASALRRAWLGA